MVISTADSFSAGKDKEDKWGAGPRNPASCVDKK
jgi:hypothetical protein